VSHQGGSQSEAVNGYDIRTPVTVQITNRSIENTAKILTLFEGPVTTPKVNESSSFLVIDITNEQIRNAISVQITAG
jgi:hypothetical protein